MKTITFSDTIPTDRGFVGRACDAPSCGQYFKVHQDDCTDQMYCPYCGDRFSKSKLTTREQTVHIRKAGKEEALFYAKTEVQKALKRAFGSSASRSAGVQYRPGKIRRRPVRANYSERKLDSELQCPVCQCRFQVYGIFGYCPACGESNLKVYDTNWAKIEQEVLGSDNPDRALRHAYGDLVSSFEVFCGGKAKRLSGASPSFQMLFDARKYFKSELSIDVLDGIEPGPLLSIRRLFQKRHVCVHAGGAITDRYVKMIPEDKQLHGQQVELSLEELKEAAAQLRIVIVRIIRAIERPG